MADILVLKTSPERIDENTTPGVRPNALVHEYLREHLDIYRELCTLREQASLVASGSQFQYPIPD